MKRYTVTVVYPTPLIGTDRVEVNATTHAHASLLVRAMRAVRGWPRGSTYTPRLVDSASYEQHVLDSDFGRLVQIDIASGKDTVLTPDAKWDVENFTISDDDRLLA